MIGRYLIALLLLCPAAFAAVQVDVDRTQLSVNDSFTLTLRATDGEDLKNTNFSGLQNDFAVESSSTQTRIVTTMGKTERINELRIVLRPKRTGNLVIPSLRVDGNLTQPIKLQVAERRADLNATDVFFVETALSDNSVYVQQQTLLFLRIYQAINLDNLSFAGLNLTDVEQEQLATRNYNKLIDGVTYKVTEAIFSLIPQKEGIVRIPALEIAAEQRGRSFFDPRSRVTRRSEPLSLSVLGIPPTYPASDWLPASALYLVEDWSSDPQKLSVGDSITRTLTIRANGISGNLLPPLEPPQISGIKMYPDQPSQETITADDGISALGVNSSAWVITEGGTFEIPAVEIPWWDITTNSLQVARIPARTLNIAPKPIPQTTVEQLPSPTAAATDTIIPMNTLWPALSVALGLAWLITLGLLFRAKKGKAQQGRQPTADAKASQIFKSLQLSCQKNEPEETRRLLLELGNQLAPENSSGSMQALATLGRSDLADAIDELNSCLYSANPSSWRGDKLASEIKALQRDVKKKRSDDKGTQLQPMYESAQPG